MVKVVIAILNLWQSFINKCRLKNMHLGYMGKNVMFAFPSCISNPSRVYLHDYSRLQRHHTIYNDTGKFILKEYSGASVDLLVVTGNHKPTVGIPQYLLGPSHINDDERDVIVEEDVWIGARVTLLAGAHLGRGAVIGANTLVNKEIPPYAVAVGSPARIIAAKFTIDEILEHEKILYPAERRFTKEYLTDLFKQYYEGKRTIGISCDLGQTNLDYYKKLYNFEYLSK